MRYLLVGNYGTGNLGDELLREYFLRTFPEVQWTVVAAACSEFPSVPRFPFGLRSLLCTPWWQTIAALRSSDGIVFGGGTLFTDIESIKAPLLWWWHAFVAWIFRRKIILAFQGIGPFRSRVGEWGARWTVRHAEFVLVRDEHSMERIASWSKRSAILSFDPVLSFFEQQQHTNARTLVIVPRANASQEFFDAVEEKGKRESLPMMIVSFEPSNPKEILVCRRLAEITASRIVSVTNLQSLKDAFAGARFVLTQRYHGAVAALGMGIPYSCVPQGKADKLDAIHHVSRAEAIRFVREGEALLRGALAVHR